MLVGEQQLLLSVVVVVLAAVVLQWDVSGRGHLHWNLLTDEAFLIDGFEVVVVVMVVVVECEDISWCLSEQERVRNWSTEERSRELPHPCNIYFLV